MMYGKIYIREKFELVKSGQLPSILCNRIGLFLCLFKIDVASAVLDL